MSRALKSWVLLAIGWLCVIVGLISLPTPLPLGAILFAVGLPILYRESRLIRRAVLAVGQRFPGLSRMLRRALQRSTAAARAWAESRPAGGVTRRLATLILPTRPDA
ncbi:MAG: hypothetical protein QNJ92_03760 [Alphaproteobacteria bacterium]|nr:hypothetical protein [Alphaproteobacteria bacterium]